MKWKQHRRVPGDGHGSPVSATECPLPPAGALTGWTVPAPLFVGRGDPGNDGGGNPHLNWACRYSSRVSVTIIATSRSWITSPNTSPHPAMAGTVPVPNYIFQGCLYPSPAQIHPSHGRAVPVPRQVLQGCLYPSPARGPWHSPAEFLQFPQRYLLQVINQQPQFQQTLQ